MAEFLQSPGVQVIEKDASAITPGASSTTGGTVGVFQWGPVMYPMLLSSETDLVSVFGKPDENTFDSFYSAANFLSYTSALYVTRAATGNLNATAVGTGVLIKNNGDYDELTGLSASGAFTARYPGVLGNSIKVSIADSGTWSTWAYKDQFGSAPGTSDFAASKGGSNDELHIIVIDIDGKFTGTPGEVLEKYEFVSKASDAISYTGLSNYYVNVIRNQSSYVYFTAFPTGTTNWGTSATGVTFSTLTDTVKSLTITAASQAADVATLTFASQTVKPFTVGQSITVTGMTPATYNGTFVVTACTLTTVKYALVGTVAAGTVFGTVADTAAGTIYDFTYSLTGGTDDNAPTDGELTTAWDLYLNTETYDISLFFVGNVPQTVSMHLVQNIADVRKDAVAFVSMTKSDGTPIFGTSSTRQTDATAFKTAIGNSTYAVIDSGFKYMYDKYNDKYRWVALNSDIAGLCAKVDKTQDTWFSPAGLTKGQIRGAVKLAWNPNQADRDVLYKLSINPVVSFAGQGTLLYGDKTATLKPSAFDRINVRRLFLVLEKSISRSARYQLFEINDSITQQQFIASVEPFLRDIQGRRGIDSFKVVCDSTVNTPAVVSSNRFVGNILVKPLYSISYITLTFTAVGASVSFETAAAV